MTSRAVFVSAQLCFIIQMMMMMSFFSTGAPTSISLSSPVGLSASRFAQLIRVPELVNLTLLESTIGIIVKWSLKNSTSFPNLRFRVTTAGVNKIVSQNSYNISGVSCNTSYVVKVSLVNAAGADYGVSKYATIMTKGVLAPVNLTLQATHNEIIVRWSVKDPKCFPDALFQIYTPAGYKLGTYNVYSYIIAGLTCNTSYYVEVAPFSSSSPSILGDSVNGTIATRGLPEAFNLVLKATLHEITASWNTKDPKCFPNLRFRITTAGVDKIVSQSSYDINGIACMTSYVVKVSPVDAAGADYGVSTNATIKTTGDIELVNSTLQETRNVVTVGWSLKDPQCFSDLRFSISSTYSNEIISQYSYNISEITCNGRYYVSVHAVDANGFRRGPNKDTYFTTKGVPEVYPPILYSNNDVIQGAWTLKANGCNAMRFRVTTAGVDKIVTGTSFQISGVRTCNITYNITVSPVDANGTSYGIAASATVKSAGVPQLFNLTLPEANNEITARWTLKDPLCFPSVRFRVTTAGVNKMVLENSFNISGIACNTSYFVKVSPVDVKGFIYGDSTNATILAKGVPEVGNLVLSSTVKEIRATWSLKNTNCFPAVRFLVTTAGVDKIVAQNSFNISALACNTSYNVQVSPVNATGHPYGVATNATMITKGGVPEVIDLILKATKNEITARWSLTDPTCFPNVMFRVTSAGVNKTVSENSSTISGLACDTSYDVRVSPIDAAGADYGIARRTSIITLGVPEVIDLILKATSNEITMRWSLTDPTCFSKLMFRVTSATARVNKIVSQNSFVMSGLDCDTRYDVFVSATDAAGTNLGFSRLTSIITLGVQVTLRAMVAESLVVKWAPVQGSCKTFSSYEVTLSLPDGTSTKKILTPKTHCVFAGLKSSTAYRVQVQPLDAKGRAIGRAVATQETTLHIDTAAGRCPYPTLVIAVWPSVILCARVDKPTPTTNLEANKVCYDKHPHTPEFQYVAVIYLVASGWATYGYLQEYLRMFDYTGKFLVNGYYKNGAWVWGFGTNYADTYPIDPALLSGLPNGGDGPNDFKMLYTDSANDFALKTAKNGFPFDGMICAFPLKV